MTITLRNCAADLLAVLNGQTLGGVTLVEQENLFPVPMPDASSLCVTLINTGGDTPEPYLDPTRAALMGAWVQILVHAPPGVDGFELGEGLARGVFGAVQQLGAELTGCITAICDQSAPTYLGTDPDTSSHYWSINAKVMFST